MVRRLTVVVGLAISLVVARKTSADPIGPDAFISPTLINFESAPDGRIDGRYSSLGVTFSELFGGGFADVGTGSGVTGVATNFPVSSVALQGDARTRTRGFRVLIPASGSTSRQIPRTT
jgi:hypothetical protein